MFEYAEKVVDIRKSDKYIDFIYNFDYLVTIKNVERIKEELISFKIKPKDNWYITIYFDDFYFSQKYEMEHSTISDSKYKSFRRVADKAMKKLNVDLNELIDKRFIITVAKIYRLDRKSNKYEIFNRITDMQLIDNEINEKN